MGFHKRKLQPLRPLRRELGRQDLKEARGGRIATARWTSPLGRDCNRPGKSLDIRATQTKHPVVHGPVAARLIISMLRPLLKRKHDELASKCKTDTQPATPNRMNWKFQDSSAMQPLPQTTQSKSTLDTIGKRTPMAATP